MNARTFLVATGLALTTAASSAPARAATPYRPYTSARAPASRNTTVVQPDTSSFQSGSSYYRVGVAGIGEYMGELRHVDPAAFEELEPEWKQLKMRRNVGWGVVGGFSLLGGVVAVGGTTFLQHRSTDEFGVTQTSTNRAALGAGLALLAVGLVGVLIIPRRGAILRFINAHNAVRPRAPLTYNAR